MTTRVFLKLIAAALLILLAGLVSADLLVSRVAEASYRDTLTKELIEKCRMLALLGDTARQEVKALARAGDGRLTVIAPDGRVLADSEADARTMENHAARPEIVAALKGKPGWAVRRSPTMAVDFLYAAVPFPGGALRMAVPLADIRTQVNAIRMQILAAMALAFVPAILLAALLARVVSSRLGAIIDYAAQLAAGNFGNRLESDGPQELRVLIDRLNDTSDNLRRAVQELEREHAELEKLERVRKDFVINVSHELRTPLASIQGYTETLLDGAIHDQDHNVKFLSIIRQNAERLGRLAADLLTISRIELRTQQFQFASYYVNHLITEVVDSMAPMAEKKGISIETAPAPEGAEVFCDAPALHQVMTNLLDNAIKYTPEGGRIVVGARVGKELEIFVRDTGIGIPPEDLPRLFERFYRVDKARSRELGGTGLGLAIVKHLVRAHGGDVRVSSVLNRGSEFSFTLPDEIREDPKAAALGRSIRLEAV